MGSKAWISHQPHEAGITIINEANLRKSRARIRKFGASRADEKLIRFGYCCAACGRLLAAGASCPVHGR